MNPSRILDMQALRIFLTTARAGNMSTAAKALGITQPAVSQAIRGLEEYFGMPLLNRKHRPLTLTPAGLALSNRGNSLLEESLNLRGAVLEASKGIKPDLRLGLVDSYAGTCGTSLIRELLARVGQLSVRTGLTPYHAEALVRREFDLVIATDPLDDVTGVVRQRILTEQYFVIAPQSFRPSLRRAADLQQLSDTLPIIRFNSASHSGAQVDRCLRRLNMNIPRRLEVDTADTLTSMVEGGLGWAVTTPLCLLQAGRTQRALRRIFLPDLPAHRSMYVLAREQEFTVLMRQVYDIASLIVENEILPQLKAIDERLAHIFKVEPWNQPKT